MLLLLLLRFCSFVVFICEVRAEVPVTIHASVYSADSSTAAYLVQLVHREFNFFFSSSIVMIFFLCFDQSVHHKYIRMSVL